MLFENIPCLESPYQHHMISHVLTLRMGHFQSFATIIQRKQKSDSSKLVIIVTVRCFIIRQYLLISNCQNKISCFMHSENPNNNMPPLLFKKVFLSCDCLNIPCNHLQVSRVVINGCWRSCFLRVLSKWWWWWGECPELWVCGGHWSSLSQSRATDHETPETPPSLDTCSLTTHHCSSVLRTLSSTSTKTFIN